MVGDMFEILLHVADEFGAIPVHDGKEIRVLEVSKLRKKVCVNRCGRFVHAEIRVVGRRQFCEKLLPKKVGFGGLGSPTKQPCHGSIRCNLPFLSRPSVCGEPFGSILRNTNATFVHLTYSEMCTPEP